MATPVVPLADAPLQTFQSSGLRQKVDQLMDILWAGGVNNPMDAIEQISYLLFLRLLWEKDELMAVLSPSQARLFSGEWARYGWGNFVSLTGDQLFDSLRAAIEKIHELPALSPTGRLLFERATLKVYDRPTLRAVVQAIQGMDLEAHGGVDLKGDMYEYLLSLLATSGTNGQFRTPRHIIRMIVEMVDPQPHERICDPACGTAGFLIAAYEHILRAHTPPVDLARGELTGALLKPAQWEFLWHRAFTGFDNDANMVKIGIMNLYLHKLEQADVRFHNPLTQALDGGYPGQRFDVILANPPFSGAIQKESILADINLPTRDTEKLFLKWFIDHLTPGGRAGVIIPNGVLFGSDRGSVRLRQLLLKECGLQAVVTLPSGVFKPYAGVATSVLIFQKGGNTEEVWFYQVTADGFSLTDTRTPILANDIPDLLAKWPGREEGPNSFRVPVTEIAAKDYELLPARYKKHEIEEKDYGDPRRIIDEVLTLEQAIQQRLLTLRAQLEER